MPRGVPGATPRSPLGVAGRIHSASLAAGLCDELFALAACLFITQESHWHRIRHRTCRALSSPMTSTSNKTNSESPPCRGKRPGQACTCPTCTRRPGGNHRPPATHGQTTDEYIVEIHQALSGHSSGRVHGQSSPTLPRYSSSEQKCSVIPTATCQYMGMLGPGGGCQGEARRRPPPQSSACSRSSGGWSAC